MAKFEIGDIVECIDDNCSYHGAQGIVFGQDPESKELLLFVDPKHEFYQGHSCEEDEKFVRFPASTLKKVDDWSSGNLAELLFGRMFHRLSTYKQKFVLGKVCCYEDCSEMATQRILVNVWGTVVEEDVCEKHAPEYHGKCIDGPFPDKP